MNSLEKIWNVLTQHENKLKSVNVKKQIARGKTQKFNRNFYLIRLHERISFTHKEFSFPGGFEKASNKPERLL